MSAEDNREYAEIYTEDYYSGKDSFFYKLFGGYKDVTPYFNRMARWFSPYVADGKILDIGCAYGFFLDRFSNKGDLFGVDVSDHAIEVANKLYPQHQFNTAILGIDPLPFEDNTFETVISMDVVEHLRFSDQPAGMKDVLRVLKPGGRWLISTPNRSILRRIFYRIPDRMEHHFGMRDHKGWINFLISQGFELDTFWTYLHGMLPFRWKRGILPELAVVVKKPALLDNSGKLD